jgi:protein-tyrosine phosphatase
MNAKPHILFVCGRNQQRSPTAARLYAHDQRIEVRSVGVGAQSRRQVTEQDISWADLILLMEQKYKARLLDTFRELDLPVIDSLDIPDEYEFMNRELVELIRAGTEFHLKHRLGIEQPSGGEAGRGG